MVASDFSFLLSPDTSIFIPIEVLLKTSFQINIWKQFKLQNAELIKTIFSYYSLLIILKINTIRIFLCVNKTINHYINTFNKLDILINISHKIITNFKLKFYVYYE